MSDRVKIIVRVLNLTAFCLLMALQAIMAAWPEHLAQLRLTPDEARMVSLQLISFLLLLGGFQLNLHATWRRLSLAAAFIVLGEATMIAVLLPGVV